MNSFVSYDEQHKILLGKMQWNCEVLSYCCLNWVVLEGVLNDSKSISLRYWVGTNVTWHVERGCLSYRRYTSCFMVWISLMRVRCCLYPNSSQWCLVRHWRLQRPCCMLVAASIVLRTIWALLSCSKISAEQKKAKLSVPIVFKSLLHWM